MSMFEWKNISWKSKCIIVVQGCIMLCCLICLIVQGVRCIEKYIKKDTRVIQKIMPLKNATFLAFTVCPSFGDAYKLQVLQSYGSSKDMYKGGTYKPSTLSDS
jgi:hypothetical protein